MTNKIAFEKATTGPSTKNHQDITAKPRKPWGYFDGVFIRMFAKARPHNKRNSP